MNHLVGFRIPNHDDFVTTPADKKISAAGRIDRLDIMRMPMQRIARFAGVHLIGKIATDPAARRWFNLLERLPRRLDIVAFPVVPD